MPPPQRFVTMVLAKIIHYKDRTNRLICSVKETPTPSNLFSNWRRSFNQYNKFYLEYHRLTAERVSTPPIEPNGIASTSFTRKLYQIVNEDSISESLEINSIKTRQLHNNNQSSNLKESVADFFAKVELRGNQPIANKPAINPNNFNQKEVGTTHDTPIQWIRYQMENSYKLRQRWGLSFEGSDTPNVHDFINRLEQMAVNDGVPHEVLPRILYLFLTKKADDWYWVHKSNNPKSDWTQTKMAILNYTLAVQITKKS